jgi:hypothetical protein
MSHRDSIVIGSAPYEEDCVQVNRAGDYHEAMLTECKRFKEMLEKVFPEPPEGAHFKITTNPHDFGTYYEVSVSFIDVEDEVDDNPSSDELGVEYALFIESHTPATWDDTAVFDKLRRAQVRKQEVEAQLGR